jgi:O-antigen/teichoic acid export membrane protein
MQTTQKNIMWNFIGYVFPILITLLIIPFTIELLGTENFGILSLIWMIVGYSSFLDFGIGRALTHYISSNKFTETECHIPSVVKKVLILLFLVSSSIAFIGFVSIEFIFKTWVESDWVSANDILLSSKIAIVTSFFVIISSAVRGVLEGYEEFKYINFVRLFSGISISISPFLIYSIIPKLWVVILSFLLIRLIEIFLYSIFARKILKKIKHREPLTFDGLKKILSFGLWSNLTNIIGSPMAAAYLDKAVIASVLGAAAITYYSVPFDVIARFLILPAMITGVLFPLLSKLKGQKDEIDRLTLQALEIMGYVIAPFFLVAIVLAKPLMNLWLGEISLFMYFLLQIFAVGKFAESLNFVLLAQIQALGRPDLTAKRHMFELPFYACGIYIASMNFGLIGVAIVWSSWAILDLLILFYLRYRLTKAQLPENIGNGKTPLIYLGFFFTAYLLAEIFTNSNYLLLLMSIFIVIVFYFIGWYFLLDKNNRNHLAISLSPLLVRIKLKSK